MSRIPTPYDVAIIPGLSMPNGDPAEPYVGTNFMGSMIGGCDYLPPLVIGRKTVKFSQ